MSDEALNEVRTMMDELKRRLDKVEASISRLSRDKGSSSELDGQVSRLSRKVESEVESLKKINGRVESIIKGLQDTPGY